MATTKPDIQNLWASTSALKTAPSSSKINTGWIVEKPAVEYMNWIQARVDEYLAHLNERGTPQWDTNTTYLAGAIVFGSDGKIYQSQLDQSGNDPTTDNGINWLRFGGDMGIAPYYGESKEFTEYYANKFYQPDIDIPGTVSSGGTANKLYYLPFVPRVTHTFTGLSVYCSGVSNNGKKARLGIYNSSNGEPSSRLLDAGEITFTATPGVFTVAISQQLNADTLYFLAMVEDSSITLSRVDEFTGSAGKYPELPNQGYLDIHLGDSAITNSRYESHTYGALPANAGTILNGFADVPMIWLKA